MPRHPRLRAASGTDVGSVISPPSGSTAAAPTRATVLVDADGNALRTSDNGDGTASLSVVGGAVGPGGAGLVLAAAQEPLVDSDTGGAGGAVTSSLVAAGGKRPYLSTVSITARPATAAVTGQVTITGVTDATSGLAVTLKYEFVQDTTGGRMHLEFPAGLCGAVDGTITVSVPAIATGGVVSIALTGYRAP